MMDDNLLDDKIELMDEKDLMDRFLRFYTRIPKSIKSLIIGGIGLFFCIDMENRNYIAFCLGYLFIINFVGSLIAPIISSLGGIAEGLFKQTYHYPKCDFLDQPLWGAMAIGLLFMTYECWSWLFRTGL